jgi:hypothetical protein
MTEQEWLACADSQTMLAWTHTGSVKSGLPWCFGQSNGRKLRLFAAACVRRFWHLLADEASRRAIEAAERYAEGLISERELSRFFQEAWVVFDTADLRRELAWEAYSMAGGDGHADSTPAWAADLAASAARAALAAADSSPFQAARQASFTVSWCVEQDHQAAERAAQAALLQDAFGPLPFRAVPVEPGWLTPAVLGLAQTVYDRRQLPVGLLPLDHLAILADALEEAGCTEADMLTHLRGPGPHTRGCWPLDALLGRE